MKEAEGNSLAKSGKPDPSRGRGWVGNGEVKTSLSGEDFREAHSPWLP